MLLIVPNLWGQSDSTQQMVLDSMLHTQSDSSAKAQKDSTRNAQLSDWHFRLTPHIWFLGMTIDIVSPPLPEEPSNFPQEDSIFPIDIRFRDISQDIKYIFMLSGEYDSKHIFAKFNYSGLILEGEAITPYDLVIQNVTYRFVFNSGDLSVGYHIFKNPKVDLDPVVGLRFAQTKVIASTDLLGLINYTGERKKFWVDPLLGLRLKYIPHPRIEFSALGDVGGFLFGSEFTYQFIGLINVICHKNFYIATGYRLWSTNVDKKEAVIIGKFKGPLFKLGVQF